MTLLPIISKVFCRMMLKRIRIGIGKKLQKEQAGFRAKRSTTEQIFILRKILEQANEWRLGLYIHFVDFENAFDLIHRGSLWNILRSYGICWNVAKAVARNRECWAKSVTALCAYWREEK